ncbi:glycosyltransferase involved in cell wall biosynthesis [Wenyingzhuangia heitensis]|uniref:Glycosyltransferase involved in cell wall biosynthesis n=1 Tax=Wenyingzhuangia heitensis TaxID=1487859 RepID=A0ABX0U9C5_9FLAO|nr:glycosyltransferase family A protein [Wenyingzhuangia heitensis]NIJ45439.1 glycosyltransferase involved in cell wall biosynthesis [Wenyingzhuangia heitensis]
MIVLLHDGIKPVKYINTITNSEIVCKEKTVQESLYKLSNEHPKELLLWCLLELKNNINYREISSVFHHELIFASYGNSSVSDNIGYVDQHCFINVKKDVQYPTWIMSGDIGGVYASVLQQSKDIVKISQSFDMFLSSFAKLSMPKGLFCYSEPKLIIDQLAIVQSDDRTTNTELFKFVKRHYKVQWVFILFFLLMYNQNKFCLKSLLVSFFVIRPKRAGVNFKDIKIQSIKEKERREHFTIDVLIPTLGRKEHLYNVLLDLSTQIILPKKVIIVEQNGEENSVSELDYLNNDWPFEIDHTFTHQLGACNARNIALSRVTSNWVFFADDDIRFKENLLEKSYHKINDLGTNCIVMSCLQEKEEQKKIMIIQSEHFGSGTSIVKASLLKEVSFKKEHEFGYGEDSDFGMQLRNNGDEIVNVPQISMLHLKAPVGGFRAKVSTKWEKEFIQPKPSPTVMAYNLKHLTKEQLQGYKFLLGVKFYNNQTIKDPYKYFKNFKQRWEMSVKWGTKLMEHEV